MNIDIRLCKIFTALLVLLQCSASMAQGFVSADKVKFNPTVSPEGFVHPGIGCTMETLDNLRQGVVNGQSPWVDYFIGLRRSKYAGLDTSLNKCNQITNNSEIAKFADDAQLAWTQAVLYVVTGNEEYRKIPLELIEWYGARKDFFPAAFPDSHIKLGKYVYVFCAAAEIMRYTTPKDMGLSVSRQMLADFERNCIRPIRSTILENKGYFMNQHSYALVGYVAASILGDDMEGYKDAVEMATVNRFAPNQGFNGSIKSVLRLVDKNDETGAPVSPRVQLVEMGRDESHAFGNVDNLNLITRIIDMQGTVVDPVSGEITDSSNGVKSGHFLNDRILDAAEAFCRYNAGYGIEWIPVIAKSGDDPSISSIYRNISPEQRGRVDMNGIPALYFRYLGLGCDFDRYPAVKESAAKAITSQKKRVETGEFINTLHNYNFDFFAGLPKESAVGTPDPAKAHMAVSMNLPPYDGDGDGIRQIEDLFMDLSSLGIDGVSYPHSIVDIPLRVLTEGDDKFVRVTLRDGNSRTMVNIEGNQSCPVGITGIRVRADRPVCIDLHNGEDYTGLHPAFASIYVPPTESEWKYVIFERDPSIITNSTFGFSNLLYFNVRPLEDEATVDFDLFNSRIDENDILRINTTKGIEKLYVCPGYKVEKNFNNAVTSTHKVRFVAQNLPAGATLDAETGIMEWKPSKKDKGLHRFYLVVEENSSVGMIPVEVFVGDKEEILRNMLAEYTPGVSKYVSATEKGVNDALAMVRKAGRKTLVSSLDSLKSAIDRLELLNPVLLGENGSLDYTKTAVSSRGLNIFVYSNGDNYDCAGIFGPDKEFTLDFGENFAVHMDSVGMQPRANFPDRVKGTVLKGSNDGKNWTEITQHPAGVNEKMQYIPVKDEEKMKAYRYLKIYMPNDADLPGLLDLGELRLHGERIERSNPQ